MSGVKLSIILATKRAQQIAEFLTNLNDTARDYEFFEVLIVADKFYNDVINTINKLKVTLPFSVILHIREEDKTTYTLNREYNELLFNQSTQTSYFVWNLTDEIRINTQGWDQVIKEYISYYPDDIFRLNISNNKFKIHSNILDSITCPENYPITTRKWLQIVGGWGEYWGTDSWQQCIVYYLDRVYGTRSIALKELDVCGMEAGIGDEVNKERDKKIFYSYKILLRYQSRLEFVRLATRLKLHIYAIEQGIKEYYCYENKRDKQLELYDIDKKNVKIFAYQMIGGFVSNLVKIIIHKFCPYLFFAFLRKIVMCKKNKISFDDKTMTKHSFHYSVDNKFRNNSEIVKYISKIS